MCGVTAVGVIPVSSGYQPVFGDATSRLHLVTNCDSKAVVLWGAEIHFSFISRLSTEV